MDLRIDPSKEPHPDILASQFALTPRYPTTPENLFVIEILSPDDAFRRVFQKCRDYTRMGIQPVFFVDPEARDCWVWSLETSNLERVKKFELPGGRTLRVDAIWDELDR